MIHAEFSIEDGTVVGIVSRAGDEYMVRSAFGLIMLPEMLRLIREGEYDLANELGSAIREVCGWDVDDYAKASQDAAELGAWAMRHAAALAKSARLAETAMRERGAEAVKEAEAILAEGE